MPISINIKRSRPNESSNAKAYKGRISKKGMKYRNWNSSWKNGKDGVYCVL